MVVDDHQIVRQGLVGMCQMAPDMVVVAEAEDGKQAIDQFRTTRPDVTLIDLRMPVMDGVDAIRLLKAEFPNSKFIVLSTYDGDENIYRAIKAGARSYLLKAVKCRQLLDTIRSVHSGLFCLPDELAAQLEHRRQSMALTPRELKILELIVHGKSNKEIAQDLKITEGTVKWYITGILPKLGVRDRKQAIAVAIERGIVHMK
jgi:two-component system NarL family response regulator